MYRAFLRVKIMKFSITEDNVTELILAGLKHTMFAGKDMPDDIVVDLPKSNRDGYVFLDIPQLDFGILIGGVTDVAAKTEPVEAVAEVKKDEPVKPRPPFNKGKAKEADSKPKVAENVTGDEEMVKTKPTTLFKTAPDPTKKADSADNPDLKKDNIATDGSDDVPFETEKAPAAAAPTEEAAGKPTPNLFAKLKAQKEGR